jgi:membrane associated rhomboid family serine protease
MLPFKDNIPRTRFPIVTVALIAVNVVAHLLEVRHGSFLALFGNMAFLALFGPAVEDAVGRLRHPAFNLLGALFVEQLYVELAGLATVGGSGSTGALVAYAAHLCCFLFGLLLIRLFVRRGRAEHPLPVY